MAVRKKPVAHTDEDIRFYYDFLWKAIGEAVNALYKGVGLFLAFMAGLIAYFVVEDSTRQYRFLAILIAILVSIVALVGGSTIGYGIVKGMDSLNKVIKLHNGDLYEHLDIDTFINRGRMAIRVSLACIILALIVLAVGIVQLS